MAKLNKEEQHLLDAFVQGELQPVANAEETMAHLLQAAEATVKKDQRLNIRISSKDLRSLQRYAMRAGLPYQTLAASILHKFVEGHFVEKQGT